MSNLFENGHALIIGVGKDLPITVKDAESIYNVLTNETKGAYNKNNVQLLTNYDATRQNIEQALDNLSAKCSQDPNATAIIYYSGHGAELPDLQGKTQYYLLPFDYELEDSNTFLPSRVFTEKINGINAKKMMVILDCCHAGGQESTSKNIQEKAIGSITKPANVNQQLIKTLKEGEGKVFLASCEDNELSYIKMGDQNSLFTKHLVQAMNGSNSDHYDFVHVMDLIQHLFRAVPQEAMSINKKQTPVITSAKNLNANFFVCANSQREMVAVKSLGNPSAIKMRSQDEINQQMQEYQNQVNNTFSNISAGNNVVINVTNNYGGGNNPSGGNGGTPPTSGGSSEGYLEESKKLIQNGKIDKALKLLLENVRDEDINQMLIIQSSRLKTNNRKLMTGVSDDRQAERTNNQITMALLSIIEEIEDL